MFVTCGLGLSIQSSALLGWIHVVAAVTKSGAHHAADRRALAKRLYIISRKYPMRDQLRLRHLIRHVSQIIFAFHNTMSATSSSWEEKPCPSLNKPELSSLKKK
jgi:hypothetical protein